MNVQSISERFNQFNTVWRATLPRRNVQISSTLPEPTKSKSIVATHFGRMYHTVLRTTLSHIPVISLSLTTTTTSGKNDTDVKLNVFSNKTFGDNISPQKCTSARWCINDSVFIAQAFFKSKNCLCIVEKCKEHVFSCFSETPEKIAKLFHQLSNCKQENLKHEISKIKIFWIYNVLQLKLQL